MLSRYRKIKEDSRFSAAEDRGQYSVCPVSATKLMSFISFCLLLSPFIFKASGACETWVILKEMEKEKAVLKGLKKPTYLLEEKLLRRNLEVISDIAKRADVEIILAFKALRFGRRSRCFANTYAPPRQAHSTRHDLPRRSLDHPPTHIRRLTPMILLTR